MLTLSKKAEAKQERDREAESAPAPASGGDIGRKPVASRIVRFSLPVPVSGEDRPIDSLRAVLRTSLSLCFLLSTHSLTHSLSHSFPFLSPCFNLRAVFSSTLQGAAMRKRLVSNLSWC